MQSALYAIASPSMSHQSKAVEQFSPYSSSLPLVFVD